MKRPKLNVVSQLMIEDVQGKTWPEVFRHYFPKMSDSEIDFLLFEHTCYPFDHAKTLEQIYKIYQHRLGQARDLMV